MQALSNLLRYLAIAASVVIALSWVMFAANRVDDASKETQSELTDGKSGDPGSVSQNADDRSGLRKAIDSVSDTLTSPFDPLVDSVESQWARKSVPALLGVLLYGLGLAMLSRALVTRA